MQEETKNLLLTSITAIGHESAAWDYAVLQLQPGSGPKPWKFSCASVAACEELGEHADGFEAIEEALHGIGQLGWELVTVYPQQPAPILVFKRRGDAHQRYPNAWDVWTCRCGMKMHRDLGYGYCPFCGETLPSGITLMMCWKCKKLWAEIFKYCPDCSRPVEEVEDEFLTFNWRKFYATFVSFGYRLDQADPSELNHDLLAKHGIVYEPPAGEEK